MVRTSRLITFDFFEEKIKVQEENDIWTICDKKVHRTNVLLISSFGKFSNKEIEDYIR